MLSDLEAELRRLAIKAQKRGYGFGWDVHGQSKNLAAADAYTHAADLVAAHRKGEGE